MKREEFNGLKRRRNVPSRCMKKRFCGAGFMVIGAGSRRAFQALPPTRRDLYE